MKQAGKAGQAMQTGMPGNAITPRRAIWKANEQLRLLGPRKAHGKLTESSRKAYGKLTDGPQECLVDGFRHRTFSGRNTEHSLLIEFASNGDRF